MPQLLANIAESCFACFRYFWILFGVDLMPLIEAVAALVLSNIAQSWDAMLASPQMHCHQYFPPANLLNISGFVFVFVFVFLSVFVFVFEAGK